MSSIKWLLTYSDKNSNDMKDKLTEISDDLNYGIITEKEAKDKLLILCGVIHWVAISDKLPPQEDNVLTYTEKGEIHVGKYRGTFWIIGNQFSFDMGEPTHWAKLPKPPCV